MEKYEALKWRWEFMRRNSEYKTDYAEVAKLRNKANYNQNRMEYYLTPEGKQESEFCQKWEIGKMFDPEKAFEELFPCIGLDLRDEKPDAERVNKWATQIYSKFQLDYLGSNSIKVLTGNYFIDDGHTWTLTQFSGKDDTEAPFIISIDFKKVNSLKALQEEVSALLEKYYDAVRAAIIEENGKWKLTFKEKKKTHQKYSTNYDLLIRVGDMKEKGMTNQQIARSLFPRDFVGTDDDIAKPESAIRMISHYYKSYKELIDGDYKRITYP